MKFAVKSSVQRIVLGAAFLLTVSVAGQASAQQSLVSTFNGSLGGFGGWSREAGDKPLFFNDNLGHTVTPFDCSPATSCNIVSDRGKRFQGLLLGIEGRMSVPFGSNAGFQADGTAAWLNSTTTGNVRTHLFLGSSTLGTIGALAQQSWLAGGWFARTGLEGQVWLGPFSLYGSGGYQWGDSSNEVRVKNGVFACGEARVYVLDNAYVGGGGDWTSTRAAAFANGEFQMSGNLQPLSVYAHGAIGQDGYRSVIGGIRWQFGPGTTLLARHRQDLLLPYSTCGEEQFFGQHITHVRISVE